MIDYNAGHADAFRTDMESVEYRREPLANSPDSYEKGRQDGHAYAGEVYFRNMIAAGLMKLLPFPTIPFTPPGGFGGTGGSSLELSSSGLSVAGFPVAIDPIADPALYESYERILRAQTNAENDSVKAEEAKNGSDIKNSSTGNGPKNMWTGKDKYVPELANAIEEKFPGKVKAVEKLFYDNNGKLVTDLDIELDDIVIQVKSGSAKGLTNQMETTAEATGKKVISYTPDIKKSAAVLKGVRAKGFDTFTSMEELLDFLDDYY